MDIKQIKERTDCIDLIAQDLGEGKRSGERAMYRCPFHDDHNPSFAVRPSGWKCFACGVSGDCITWLTQYRGMTTGDAIRLLGGEEVQNYKHRTPVSRPAPQAPLAEPPSAEWQRRCITVVNEAVDMLWSDDGQRALDYLHGRGLDNETIKTAQLGYAPGAPDEWKFWEGLAIPCGITIPRFADGELWGVNVRRAKGEPKYQQIGTIQRHQAELGKGHCSEAMYWADLVRPGDPLLVVEGEFDCLISWQVAGDLLCPVTLGSATNQVNPRWFAYLACARQALACYDNDKAGDQGYARLAALGCRLTRIAVPTGKDMTDFYKASGAEAVRSWLLELLTPLPIPTPKPPDEPDPEPEPIAASVGTFTPWEIDAQADAVLGDHRFATVDAGIVRLYLSYPEEDRDKFVRSLPVSMADYLAERLTSETIEDSTAPVQTAMFDMSVNQYAAGM
jgi:CHC2 zinc finger/Toprim-like